MKTQIVLINGGTTFKNKRDYLDFLKSRKISIEKKIRWNELYLDKNLGEHFEIIRLSMPLKENAKYDEWRIHFERYLPYFRRNIILIGLSLGGIFLAKYLSENKFPKKIKSIYLICPPFDNTIEGEDLVGGFKLKSDLSMIDKNCKKVSLLFSKDDGTVPISHAEKYKTKLRSAKVIIYKSKNGHFKISKFPEIVKMIKEDIHLTSH
ncbi:hypothetical protein COU56_02925 [Candidatus Pacearchaeota archaeon CG10_big_fil_rev_8_21_14_0_10_31_9]|nr:MAG: hypothetical protein AUJ62_01865 [Candidatus Pacearchaeota archaeon CG1_02_32_21]PIN94221.1 MAG: hypothetical protein COU56_02925 [Candidatus Pacearchaeota archaeon CG10_big_fil_rev_8_21_14_0_10_31_9]PIZ82996.1 MAG: hypothetical protein COX97_02050 [Candidatus Pacearchaeota archaeon CG_4_10_14_0_2_um_filter_05_32_18]